MSSADRVAVPTNGHRPTLTDDALDSSHHDASGSGDRPAAERTDPANRPSPSPVLPTVTSSQVIAGVGLLAALALLILGRRRGRD